ncbi:MAG: hypothetical protein M3546_12410 [Actinomycetota bacterium]|nr:hypothetical protein [Actinomycetota bacterium]
MLEFHLHIENIDRELREIAIQRPRLDRPEPREQSRLRTLLRGFALPPARAVCEPGARIPNVTIRAAQAADLRDLTRLAELSERRVPAGLVLVAEVETDIVAALPVAGGPLLSDFRRPTRDVAQLLELRTGQIRLVNGPAQAA